MNFELEHILLVSFLYLLLLFLCAWATDKGFIPKRIVNHPATYVLSLGVYASSWAYYGSIGVAHDDGYVFLSFYFGLSGAFLLAPVLLIPILKITSTYQLSSLPDLFAFRFRSPLAGTLTTLLLLCITFPLLALQIQAVSDSISLLTNERMSDQLAFGFCLLVAVLTILLGTRHLAGRHQNDGLVVAIAFESLLKLLIIALLGGVVIYQIFGGFPELNQWLESNSQVIIGMNSHLEDGPWRTTLLMFFASAVVMPHVFHMTFAENRDIRRLFTASWGLPFFLLLLSISTPLILWAGLKINSNYPPEYFPLAIGAALDNRLLTMIAYIGGLSAASGLFIVTSLALSSMLMNHVILPVYQSREPSAPAHINIYRWLTNVKRLVIIGLILSSYGFYRLLHNEVDMYSLSIVAYVGALQLLPGTLATLYWGSANHKGLIAGLLTGSAVWFFTLMMPLTMGMEVFPIRSVHFGTITNDGWYLAAMSSLAVNLLVFFLMSKLTGMSDEERSAAAACLVKEVGQQPHKIPQARSSYEFQEMLSAPLGPVAAQKEISKALSDLNMRADDNRPHSLRRLRDRIETNLSGLMGPTIAHDIVDSFLPLDAESNYVPRDIHFMESRMEDYHTRLTGLAGELDSLRRYHRDTLNSLPMAVCAIDSISNTSNGLISDRDVMFWNPAMAELTGIETEAVLGMPLRDIPEPWKTVLNEFLRLEGKHLTKHRIELDGGVRYLNLHKSTIHAPASGTGGNQVILMEDQTETQLLEEQLFHSERLASIGQLAAGVAHEIGNPITGIDCLAQEMSALSSDPDIKESSQQILEQTKRVSRIVQTLVSYAHSGQKGARQQLSNESISSEPVEICSTIQEAVSLLQLSHKHSNIEFRNLCSAGLCVSGNSQKLQQVFINLLKNAADASDSDPEITSLISVTTSANQHTVTIRVEDQGHGIPKEIQEKLFEPFFTTKEAGKGTGLGLALTWNIIEEHFGSIQVISPLDANTGRGTCFMISLPRYEAEPITTESVYELQGETA
ncbi:ATP-binding protein [uncultured Endozoicomonas sp.]|uniref:ATP-binding protein n=1 Tax=uncultured Endozoicomonas sp. TaxID=432652 RepID=UPI0026087403|nr:ATP-binding protein [uncultured Endozoicomonas sp.]